MQRIIIDTNVIVSALIQRSYPFLIVDSLFVDNDILLCISDELLKEYIDVLSRPKFSKFPDFYNHAQTILAQIELRANNFKPVVKINIIKDVDDNKLLELAETCNADFLITGNTNDFTMKTYKLTKIVTPKEYWEIYSNK